MLMFDWYKIGFYNMVYLNKEVVKMSIINSCWEKCNNKLLLKMNRKRGKLVYFFFLEWEYG